MAYPGAAGFGGGLAAALMGNRGARGGGGGFGGGGGPANRPKGMTVEQWARLQTSKMIGAQVKAINEAKRLYLAEINKQAEDDRGKYRDLADHLQGMNFPGQIQGIYGGASQDIMGLAGSMAAGQTATTDALGAQNQNMVSGTGQEGSLASQGGILGEVTYGTEGVIPGRTYQDVGKGFAAQAALEPGFALQIGYGDVHREKSEQMKGLKDFMLQIAEAQSQRPGMQMELAAARRGELSDSREAERDWRLKMAAMYMAQGKYDMAKQQMALAQGNTLRDDNRYAKKDQIAAWKSEGLASDGKTLLPGFHRGPNGQIVKDGWHINKKGVPAKNKAGSSASGDTPQEIQQDIQADMSQDVEDFFTETTTPGANVWDDPVDSKTPWAYEKAFKTLWAKYKGTMPSKKLRKAINEILAAAGISPKKPPAAGYPPNYDGEGPGR